ncbi:MAG TPA: dihydrofolate reductase [Phycisphaerae bacterium]|nr:dihydrofolate reductase [Phycisphaerae bacterium]
MQTIIIVAMTPDRLIGKGGALPWHEPEDLKHFKRTTMGHAVIMGRKTYDSIGRPLPGRRNIVITRNVETPKSQKVKSEDGTSLDVVHSLDEALELCRQRGEETAFIAGGAQIYEQALPVADEMIVTWIQQPGLTGDTYFPAWREEDWEALPEPAAGGLKIVRYRRCTPR